MPARFYVGFLEKTGRNRVAKGGGGSGERLQDARTSSERLRLSRTAKRSGAVVTGRLVKRAQVAHPCKTSATIRIRSPHFREPRIRIVGVKKGLIFLRRSLLCSSGLFSGRLFRGALLGSRLFRRGLTLRRPLSALFGKQFNGALMGERFDGFRTRHRNVGNTVGNIRPEPPVFDYDILLAVRSTPSSASGGLAAARPRCLGCA